MAIKKYSKLQSRKLWITIWAIIFISSTAVYSLYQKYEPGWMNGLFMMLGAEVIAYIGIQSFADSKFKSSPPKDENDSK